MDKMIDDLIKIMLNEWMGSATYALMYPPDPIDLELVYGLGKDLDLGECEVAIQVAIRHIELMST